MEPSISGIIILVQWDIFSRVIGTSFKKFRIFMANKFEFPHQVNAENDLDNPFIEWRSNMEKLNLLASFKFKTTLLPTSFPGHLLCNNGPGDELALLPKSMRISIIPLLQQNLFYLTNRFLQWFAKTKRQSSSRRWRKRVRWQRSRPSLMQLRSAIETILDISLFVESEEVQRCTMKISAMIGSELTKKLKASYLQSKIMFLVRLEIPEERLKC